MKTAISLLIFPLLFFLYPVAAQKATKGCMEVKAFNVGLDPAIPGAPFALGYVELSYSVGDGGQKSYELIINGERGAFTAVGTATLVIDLIMPIGESLTVTLNTYSSSNPGKGKLCISQSKFVESR
jgi:hypothetical protein